MTYNVDTIFDIAILTAIIASIAFLVNLRLKNSRSTTLVTILIVSAFFGGVALTKTVMSENHRTVTRDRLVAELVKKSILHTFDNVAVTYPEQDFPTTTLTVTRTFMTYNLTFETDNIGDIQVTCNYMDNLLTIDQETPFLDAMASLHSFKMDCNSLAFDAGIANLMNSMADHSERILENVETLETYAHGIEEMANAFAKLGDLFDQFGNNDTTDMNNTTDMDTATLSG